MEQQTLDIGIAITHPTTPETAGAIRTAYLMGFIQASQQFPDSVLEPEVARVAAQYLPQPETPVIGSLEGLRNVLLAPRAIVRDEKGWLTHDALPVFDEGVHIGKFLEAFGLEYAFASMESDRAEYFERWAESGDDSCAEWDPVAPEGNGWLLLEIYMTEDDCVALYARDFYEAERERKNEQRASHRRAFEAMQQRALTGEDLTP